MSPKPRKGIGNSQKFGKRKISKPVGLESRFGFDRLSQRFFGVYKHFHKITQISLQIRVIRVILILNFGLSRLFGTEKKFKEDFFVFFVFLWLIISIISALHFLL